MLNFKKNVTIVVPIYKDWETLEKCLISLKKYVDPKHVILLVNDNSSEADFLEQKIKEVIKGNENFKYFRNKENFGFVKTCNKAVFELDEAENDILLLNSDTEVTEGFLEEMIEVLNLSEKHGVVCPRSNNATLLSVPYQCDGLERADIIEESFKGYLKMKPFLRKFSIIPTGVGFCMLIKRELIRNFGLFDEIYGMGYNEENDFCSRINKFGYSVAMANHAFVFHFESKSFSIQQKNEQNIKNEKILKTRYPEFFKALDKYFTFRMDPLDYFSEIICGIYPKKRVLFCLYNLPEAYNGTSEYGLSLLKSFVSLYGEKYEITVLTSKGGAKFHGLKNKYNIIYNSDLKKSSKKFDITFAPSQIFDMELLMLLNKHSLKIVFALQDIIAWRCKYLSKIEEDFVLDYSFLFSDGIVAISDFSKKDATDFLNGQGNIVENMPPIKTIYHGLRSDKNEKQVSENSVKLLKGYGLEKGKYILIVGNHFLHKSLIETAKNIVDLPYEFVFMGINKDDLGKEIGNRKNIHCFMSGALSHDFLDFVYANCSILIFPSQYEGFGFPIINAMADRKKVIVLNNELNRELFEKIPNAKSHVVFFEYFTDLGHVVKNEMENIGDVQSSGYLRTWDDAANETEKFLAEILDKDLDVVKLENRWRTLTYIEHLSDEFSKQRKLDQSYLFGFLNTKEWQNKIKFATTSPDKMIKKHYRRYKYKLKNLF